MKNNKVTAIVLAAGMGKRMNTPVAKQYLELKNKPILYYSLKTFEDSSVNDIILVTGMGQINYCKESIVLKYKLNKVADILEGGAQRYDSVTNALEAIQQTDYVLIHDGARPFITTQLIETVITEVKKHKACILGTPVKDTVKMVDVNGCIIGTPDRSSLWAAQTPQAFEYRAIRDAYRLMNQDDNSINITDDAMVYELYMKKKVKILMGDYNNLKLTTPEDYIYAKALSEELF